MYTFRIDIGNWEIPIIGNGYIIAHPAFENGTIAREKEQDKIFDRTKVTGNIVFYGQEFDALKALSETTAIRVGIRVGFGPSYATRLQGWLMLVGNYDTALKQATLKIEPDDRYSDILSGMDQKWATVAGGPTTILNVLEASDY